MFLDTVLTSDSKDVWSLLGLFERRMTYSAGRCLHNIGRTLSVSGTNLSCYFTSLSLSLFPSFLLSLFPLLFLLCSFTFPTLSLSLSQTSIHDEQEARDFSFDKDKKTLKEGHLFCIPAGIDGLPEGRNT